MCGSVWPRAIFLDLDDTIISYSYGAEECWERLCGEYCGRNPAVRRELLGAVLEDVRRWYWKDAERHRRGRLNLQLARREIVQQVFERLGIDDRVGAEEMADSFTREREEKLELFPGAVEALSDIRRRSERMALITNGAAKAQRRKITRFSLAQFFDLIVVEGEFGAGKPDEAVYSHCLERLETMPEEAWMIGDNLEWDVAAPQRMGIKGIWLDHAGGGLPKDSKVRPDRVIGRLSDLVNWPDR